MKLCRSIHKHSLHRKQNSMVKRPAQVPAADLPMTGQTSTLRSRRKLAYMLVTAALIFAACWTPHVICLLTNELNVSETCSKSLTNFGLLLGKTFLFVFQENIFIVFLFYAILVGYAHSAFSPLINWALNRNSLMVSSTCIPLACLRSGRKFIQQHLKVPTIPPPSSTNEAQLGPFNPRYIKARPQVYADKASSHLY